MTPRKFLPVAAALCLLALAGCGNKGPLVRPADAPPPAEPMPAAPAAPAAETAPDASTLPDTTPPTQPPVTDAVAPPPAQGD